MGKIGKVITTIIIVTLFFCNISFAVNLGEKNASGMAVVAKYQNKEYVANGIPREALEHASEFLPWSKWSEEDIITIYRRCANNTLYYYNADDLDSNTRGVRDDWYVAFYSEFQKRVDDGKITVIDAVTKKNTNAFTEDKDPSIQADQLEIKKTSDMTEDDKKRAEEYKKEQEKLKEKYKGYTDYQVANHILEKKSIPEGLEEDWKAQLNKAIKRGGKDTTLYKTCLKAYEFYWGSIETADGHVAIYGKPTKSDSGTSADSLDDMISDADADDFLTKGGKNKYDDETLKQFSTILYNCFLAVGVAIALVVGIIIGIKYMMGSIEEKATYKQMLVPYLVGCLVVFGAFGIWKIVVIILESM